jgi:hypothetical protein
MKKISILFVFFAITHVYSQGCSDAGICSFSNSDSENQSNNNNLEFGYIFGKGLEDVTYNGGFISYSRKINEKLSIATKINYSQANGSFGTLGNFSDAFLTGNYRINKNENSALSVSFGAKFPFTLGNRKINEFAVPLDYQPSLGTFDALFGLDYTYKKWNFDVALQLPVFQTNKNSYFDEYSASNDFPTTNLFRRKPDALARITRNITFKNFKNFTFKPNLLAIYHLGNDSYEDIFGNRQTINNSEGLTLNANLITDYKLNSFNILSLSLASPLIVREIRPDGLTRSFTLSLSLKHEF